MASVNLKTFSSSLSALSVTGVQKNASAPPTVLNTADLPLMYPRLPTQESELVAAGGAHGLRSVSLELVIVVEPVRQDLNALNYNKVLGLIDALYDVLSAQSLALGVNRFETTVEQDAIGSGVYWIISTVVEAS